MSIKTLLALLTDNTIPYYRPAFIPFIAGVV